MNYGFVYKKKRWVETEYDTFEGDWKHNKESVGKIANALDRRKVKGNN